MAYSYHLYRSASNSQYYWNLKAGNGERVASSGETYVAKSSCLSGLNLFKTYAPSASINDKTTGSSRRVATYEFELYKDAGSEYRWRFQAANNQIIATSGEGYVTKQGCLQAIARVKANAGTAKIVDHTVATTSSY